MIIDCGQAYTATADNLSVPTTPSALDLLQVVAGSFPVLITRIYASCSVAPTAFQRIIALRRSTASTGGGSVTVNPQGAGGPAAGFTVNSICTTLGTAGVNLDNQIWAQPAPYQFDLTPRGILIPASGFYSLYLPVAPGTSYAADFTIEAIEIK